MLGAQVSRFLRVTLKVICMPFMLVALVALLVWHGIDLCWSAFDEPILPKKKD